MSSSAKSWLLFAALRFGSGLKRFRRTERRGPHRALRLVGCALSAHVLMMVGPAWSAEAPVPDSPWQVTADKISRFVNPASIIAEGNVVLVRQGLTSAGQLVNPGAPAPESGAKPLTITGDWVRLDPVANLVKVRGHAVLDSEEEHVTAELVDLDIDRQTGHLQQATIYFPKRSLYLAGAEVQKTGDLTYHLEDGWVTKCDPADGQAPPWSFGWSRADIAKEGFAHFSHTTFRIKDVPVFYTPYVAFPTNTKRKSGLLLPEWTGGSRDGAGILVPFFVNLSPSQDLTLYGGGLSERGPLAGAEFRYVQDAASKGTVALSVLNDRLTDSAEDDFKSDGIHRTISDRYWLRGKADHDFGNNLGVKLDVDLVSDQDYLQEYSDGLLGYTESGTAFVNEFGRGFEAKTTHARTNTAQLTKLWPAMTFGAEMRAISDPTAIESAAHPWSLPSITFAGSRPLWPAAAGGGGLGSLAAVTDLAWDSGYVYYWRDNGLGSHRLDLHPALKAPLRLVPYLETTAAVGLRQTMYQVDDNGAVGPGSGLLERTLSDATLSTSTILMRDFALSGPRLRRLTHMLRPGLAYTYVPAARQDDLPLFDRLDRIDAENLLTYDLSNDFDVSAADGAAWKFGYARLSQAYDLHAARRDDLAMGERRRTLTDIAFESWLQPVPDLRLIYETTLDVYGDGTARQQVGASYVTPRGDILRLEHRYDAATIINQLNLDLTVRLTKAWLAQAIVNHSLETDETSDTSLRLLYSPSCWGLALQATTTPDDDYRFTLLFSLEGVGNILGLSQTMSAAGGWRGIGR